MNYFFGKVFFKQEILDSTRISLIDIYGKNIFVTDEHHKFSNVRVDDIIIVNARSAVFLADNMQEYVYLSDISSISIIDKDSIIVTGISAS